MAAVDMTTTIQDVIEAVNDLLIANVSGLLTAFDYPPDSLPDELVMLTYYGGGTAELQSEGMVKQLFSVTCEFHVFRKDLSRDVRLLMDNIDNIRDALTGDPTLGGKVSTYEYLEITRPLADATYAGMQTLKMQFILRNIKINS